MFQSFAGHLTPFKENVPPPLMHRGSKTREQLLENLEQEHDNRVLQDSQNASFFDEQAYNICDEDCQECAQKRQGSKAKVFSKL